MVFKDTLQKDTISSNTIYDDTYNTVGGLFYRTQVNLGYDSWVRLSVRQWVSNVWLDLTDVTLADEDTKSKLTDNAKRAIQGNEAMQVM